MTTNTEVQQGAVSAHNKHCGCPNCCEAQQGGELPQDERAAFNEAFLLLCKENNSLLRMADVKESADAHWNGEAGVLWMARAALAQRAASVPAQAASEIERGLAERDAALFGTGYLVDGKRVAPEWVTVVLAAPFPAASVPDAGLMSKLPELRELAHSVLGNFYLGQDREKELAELLLAAAPQTTEKP